MCAVAPGAPVWRNPITGIAGCCAPTGSGHATAAAPTSVMNSRRFNLLNCIRTPPKAGLQNIGLGRISQEVSERYSQRLGTLNRSPDHLRYEEFIGAKKHLVLRLLSHTG